MNKFFSMFLFLLLLIQCVTKRGDYYPPANPSDLIKDSFYYNRDTLNFYELNISDRLETILDSIFNFAPSLPDNYCWTVEVVNRSFNTYAMELRRYNCEKFFMTIEYTKSMYMAMNVKGQIILAIDPYNVFEVAVSKPFIKVKNPRELKAIYQKVGGSWWLFKLDKKGEFLSVEFKQ
jgi:hypothetical protein